MAYEIIRLRKLYSWRIVALCIGSFLFFHTFLHLSFLRSTKDPIHQRHHIIRSVRNISDNDEIKQEFNRERFLYEIAQKYGRKATQKKSKYIINVYSQVKKFKKRFMKSYGKKNKNIFKHCSVKNCKVTTGKKSYKKADAIFFSMQRLKGMSDFPPKRFPHQRYIMFTDESPLHTFYIAKKAKMSDFNGLFNWTMTYSIRSDIPTPYGRTTKLPRKKRKKLRFGWLKKKTKKTAILLSNCKAEPRRSYLKKLSKYTSVDIYGKCGKLKCAGGAYTKRDCKTLHKYKFYLAFENSLCSEYITEKLWWNAFHHNALPIVLGAPKSDYKKLLPPKSYIHVEDYKSARALAKYINYLDKNKTAYKEYFKWKANYKVLNEHGYFGTPSMHICRVCEALNSRDLPAKNVHNKLQQFWNKRKQCRKSKHFKKL